MPLLPASAVVSATMFALLAGMAAIAATYPIGAGLMPILIGVPAALLAGWQLLDDIRNRRVAQTEDRSQPDATVRTFREGAAIAWLALFVAMNLAGGFVGGGRWRSSSASDTGFVNPGERR